MGLEAQRTAVTTWLNGGRWKLVDEVVEIELGQKRQEPSRHCSGRWMPAVATRPRLIISRLDRLSRDPVFLLSLRDAGIDFVALDMPEANRMMVFGIMVIPLPNRSARHSASAPKTRWPPRRRKASNSAIRARKH